jgi:hypothetical protein
MGFGGARDLQFPNLGHSGLNVESEDGRYGRPCQRSPYETSPGDLHSRVF